MALVDLSALKSYLNITRTNDDAELTEFLYDAVEAVEDVIGSLSSRTVTEEMYGSGPRIVLSSMPVKSVESVTVEQWLGAGAIDDTAAWRLNPQTGVLRRIITGGALPFYGPGSVQTVTYTVGRSDVPGPVNRAILMQAASMWRSQRGASSLPASAQQQAPPPPTYTGNVGFLGADVMELLVPYLLPPGVA